MKTGIEQTDLLGYAVAEAIPKILIVATKV